MLLLSSLQYKAHQIPKLECFVFGLALVFAQAIEARCQVGNEYVVGAAPTGNAPTTSEWSMVLLPTKVRIIFDGYFKYVGELFFLKSCDLTENEKR